MKEKYKSKEQRINEMIAENIVHDFNNILSAILSNVSLCKVQIDNKDEVYNNLSEIENIVIKAKKLTQSLLPLSKDRIPEKKLVSIPKLFEDSCSFILRSSNVSYKLNCPDDLWPVEVDENQIFQVFNNLIINSMQAMPEGGVIIIKIENIDLDRKDFVFLKTGRSIKISIKDQGTGIPEEHLNKIFDPYFTTKQEGCGLGLAIVYSIIRKHDGHITAESEFKKGSTFTIFFPASKDN